MSPKAGREQLRLLASPVFLVLWAAMLVSATGTFFLLLTASGRLLTQSGSGLSASAVFAFQWLLPVLLVRLIQRCCQTARLRRAVVSAELVQALLSLCVGVLLTHGLIVALLACFLLRGLLEAITKTARVVYTRQLFEGEQLRLASYTFNNSYYLGGALGGALGALLAGHVSMTTAAAIDAATFVVSACCYAWLPNVSAPAQEPGTRRGVWHSVSGTLRGSSELTRAVVYLVLAVGLLQGFHNAARTIVPIRLLHLGGTDVMRLQLVSGSAVFLGAVAVPVLLRRVETARRLNLLLTFAAAAAMGLLPHMPGAMTLFGLYFGYMFVFEFIFTSAQATVIQRCPPAGLVALTSFTNAVGTGLLILCTLLTGGLSDVVAFGVIAVAMALVVAGTGLAVEGLGRRKVSHPLPPAGLAPGSAVTVEESIDP